MPGQIALSLGLVALVDEACLPAVERYKWWAKPISRAAGGHYACRTENGTTIYMHRALLRVRGLIQVDHINKDGLDNRLSNLRICDGRLNNGNSTTPGGVGGYRGVELNKSGNSYRAAVYFHRRAIRCSPFDTAEDAARAYDMLARHYFGEFATLNFPEAVAGDQA